MFTGISVLAALLGFGLAWLLYCRGPQLARSASRSSMGGFYHAVVHKYYIDEIYAMAFREAVDRGFRR